MIQTIAIAEAITSINEAEKNLTLLVVMSPTFLQNGKQIYLS